MSDVPPHRYPQVEIELEIPDELREASKWCEIWCEANCCGESAFDLDPKHLADWVCDSSAEQVALVLEQADELIAELARLGPTAGLVWFSGDDPNGPKSWVEDLRECIVEATHPPETRSDGRPVIRQIDAQVRALNQMEYLGKDYWSEPLKSGRWKILLPDRPLEAYAIVDGGILERGTEVRVAFRFPLPARIQPWLSPGTKLNIGPQPGFKEAEATILVDTAPG